MGGEKPRLSQAEKKRIADEKKALKAKEMEQARIYAREQHQKASLAPLWLVQAKASFQDWASTLEGQLVDGNASGLVGVAQAEGLLQRCRYHEKQCANIIGRIDGNGLAPDGADSARELLEYLLELLSDAEGNVAEIESFDDDGAYEEIKAEKPTDAAEPPDLTDQSEPPDLIMALRALDFAETELELRVAIEQAMKVDDDSEQQLSVAVQTAREKIKRLSQQQAVSAQRAEAHHREAARHPDRSSSIAAPSAKIAQGQTTPGVEGEAGRIVQNHSTHCKGLQAVLRRLQKNSTLVKTYVPGKLHQVKAHADKFTMRLQRHEGADGSGEGAKTDANGSMGAGASTGVMVIKERVKCVARNGHTAQDVELVFWPGLEVDPAAIQLAIDNAIEPPRESSSSTADYEILPEGGGRLNLSGAEMKRQQREKATEKQLAAHQRAKAENKAAEKAKLIKEKERKLQSSAAAREGGISIKAHAKQWVDVEVGDASAGKYWGGGRSKREAGSMG